MTYRIGLDHRDRTAPPALLTLTGWVPVPEEMRRTEDDALRRDMERGGGSTPYPHAE